MKGITKSVTCATEKKGVPDYNKCQEFWRTLDQWQKVPVVRIQNFTSLFIRMYIKCSPNNDGGVRFVYSSKN